MKIRVLILTIFILFLSCKSKGVIVDPIWENNTEIIELKQSDKEKIYLNKTYNLVKTEESEQNFRIQHFDKTLYKASQKGKKIYL